MSVPLTNNITINIKEVEVALSVAEIPIVSASTKEIFKELGTDASDYLIYPLKKKAEVLTTTIQKLQDAKEHGTRDKIFATLRSALTVAILVGGILGTIAMAWCPPVAIGIGIATFLAYTAISYYNAHRAGMMDLALVDIAGPFIAWVSAPILPIYEGFGKISRLEGSILKQKKEMSTNFVELVSFFKHDRKELQKILEEEIEKSDQSLKLLSQLPSNTNAGKKEIEERLEKYRKALEELQKAKVFYSQFQIEGTVQK